MSGSGTRSATSSSRASSVNGVTPDTISQTPAISVSAASRVGLRRTAMRPTGAATPERSSCRISRPVATTSGST
jgi:hypothetical protein